MQLNLGDNVVVIRDSDKEGKINAKFISVIPAFPTRMDNSYHLFLLKNVLIKLNSFYEDRKIF